MIDRAITLSRGVLQNGRQVFFAHLVYSGFGVGILFPLVGLVGHLLLRLSGEPALTDQDILYFALTPLGAISFIFLGGLLLFVVAFEQASLMTIADATQSHRQITVLGALGRSLEQASRIFGFAVRLVVRVLLLILPFLGAAAAVAFALLTEYDINFYLTDRPPEFWWSVTLIGFLLATLSMVLIHKLLDWSLSLPLILFTDTSAAQCFGQSARLMRTNRRSLLATLVVWLTAALALGAIAVALVRLFGTLLLRFVTDSMQLLIFALGAVVVIGFIASLIVTAFTSGSFAYVIVDFFAGIHPRSPISPPRPHQRSPKRFSQGRLTAKRLSSLLAASVVVAGLTGIWLLNGIQINDDIAVIAHRGDAGSAPENTLAAVRQAMDVGADWIEIDVQETVDGEVVVIHDSDFMKLAGVNLNVWNGSFEDVRAIDIGSWFSPEFSEERVPTLAEVLSEADGRSRVIIELKYYGHDQNLEQRVVDIVEQTGMVEDVMIMSLSYQGIQKIRELRPDWKIGLLAAQATGSLAQLDADFLAVNSRIAKPPLIRAASSAGKQVFVWTINDAVNMSRMITLGVDGIITDEPGLAREVLEDRASLSSAERLLLHTALLMGVRTPERNYRDESP